MHQKTRKRKKCRRRKRWHSKARNRKIKWQKPKICKIYSTTTPLWPNLRAGQTFKIKISKISRPIKRKRRKKRKSRKRINNECAAVHPRQ